MNTYLVLKLFYVKFKKNARYKIREFFLAKKLQKKKMKKRCMNDYTDCGVREKGPGS